MGHNPGMTLETEAERATPVRIHADRAAGTLDIDWQDGHHTGFYPYRLLRERCGCAECTARRAA